MAKSGGAGRFNTVACTAYDTLNESQIQQLLSSNISSGHSSVMSAKEVIKAGAKSFKMIQRQVSYYMWCNYTRFLLDVVTMCERVV